MSLDRGSGVFWECRRRLFSSKSCASRLGGMQKLDFYCHTAFHNNTFSGVSETRHRFCEFATTRSPKSSLYPIYMGINLPNRRALVPTTRCLFSDDDDTFVCFPLGYENYRFLRSFLCFYVRKKVFLW